MHNIRMKKSIIYIENHQDVWFLFHISKYIWSYLQCKAQLKSFLSETLLSIVNLLIFQTSASIPFISSQASPSHAPEVIPTACNHNRNQHNDSHNSISPIQILPLWTSTKPSLPLLSLLPSLLTPHRLTSLPYLFIHAFQSLFPFYPIPTNNFHKKTHTKIYILKLLWFLLESPREYHQNWI